MKFSQVLVLLFFYHLSFAQHIETRMLCAEALCQTRNLIDELIEVDSCFHL
jgi:hypothetical protein